MKKFSSVFVSILASAMLVFPNLAASADDPPTQESSSTSSDSGSEPTTTTTSAVFSNDSKSNLKLTNAKAGDIFDAYKIIDITYDASTNMLSYNWNSDFEDYIKVYDDKDATKKFTVEYYRTEMSAEQRREFLAGIYEYAIKNSEKLINNPVAKNVKANADAPDDPTSTTGTAIFTDLAMGGYLIAAVETTDVYQIAFKSIEPTPDETTGKYKLPENTDFSVKAKHKSISITKTADEFIVNTNEPIEYYIIADVPSYGANAVDKFFCIKDTIPEALDVNIESISVYAHTDQNANAETEEGWVSMDSENDANYTLTYTPSNAQTGDHIYNFTVNVENIKEDAANGITENNQFDNWYSYSVEEKGDGKFDTTYTNNYKRIKIVYTATLNEKAKLASKENKPTEDNPNNYVVGQNNNEAEITYYPFPYIYKGSNPKPDTETEKTDFSVYTYGIKVFKYEQTSEESGKPLPGAKFRVYSKSTTDEQGKISGVDESSLVKGYYYSTHSNGPWTLIDDDTEIETGENGNLYIKGLKAATAYYIKETAAPAGYNLPTVPVTKIELELGESSHLLKATNSNLTNVKNAALAGYGYIEIENNSGFTLPSTGGTGIFILKILGIVGMSVAVIVISVVLFCPKKKTNE